MVNDANLAALGEARFGAGRGRSAVVHVSVVGGIGAGFVFGGRLFSGAHGFSGELLHMQVTPGGRACPCGSHGCLATEIRWAYDFPRHDERLGSLVGRALAPLVTALDPDCLVVDARLGREAKSFMTGITNELARCCPSELGESAAVVLGELDDAERFGALAAADAHAVTLLSC
jgi:predicted NBD/HSP70 family sugar kinase